MPVLTRSTVSASTVAGRESPAATDAPSRTAATLDGRDEPAIPSPSAQPGLGLRFPEGFVWGAATSAYQIEGAAALDGRGPSVWDTFCLTPGKVHDGHTGDVAADHYRLWADDLDLMKRLGMMSYRFSVSWSRILPTGSGAVNQKGLDFYRRLIAGLHERGIAPMLTLYHWDTPQTLHDQGGWENRDTCYRFAEYAAILAEALGDSVDCWITLNEPKTVVQNGYLYGSHAPGHRDPAAAYIVAHHQLLAHGLAVQAMRPNLPSGTRIGPALNLHPCYPADDSALAQEQTHRYDGYENRLYLDPIFKASYPVDTLADIARFSPMPDHIRDEDLKIIGSPVDLLAVQYYTPIYVTADGSTVQKHPLSKAFWQQIYPAGLYDILTRVRKDYGDIPMTITENGLPCVDAVGEDGHVLDPARIDFFREHFAAAHRAIVDGVKLESFHVWSFMDNFEWQEGYDERWGLIYVDYATQRRIPKRSALWYSQVIRNNAL